MQTRKIPTVQEKQAELARQYGTAAPRATVPAVVSHGAVAVPGAKTAHAAYLEEIAPLSVAGRPAKFDSKSGKWVTADDGEPLNDAAVYIALVDQTRIGWIKFNGEGQTPTTEMGLLYDGFVMRPRDSLGDTDPSRWEIGLDGQPSDPWIHEIDLVLQDADSAALYNFAARNKTNRRAIGVLLRHYDRMAKSHPGYLPLVQLKVGGYQHSDKRVGWVNTPTFAVTGRIPSDSAVQPPAAPMDDEIPF